MKLPHPFSLPPKSLLVDISSFYVVVISVGPDISYDLKKVAVWVRPCLRCDRALKFNIVLIYEPLQLFFRKLDLFWRHSNSSINFVLSILADIKENESFQEKTSARKSSRPRMAGAGRLMNKDNTGVASAAEVGAVLIWFKGNGKVVCRN